MNWLDSISPWTLASVGLGWFCVSSLSALALGRVLARTKDAAVAEAPALGAAEAAVQRRPEAVAYTPELARDWLAASDDLPYDDAEYVGRASSGTRFKPVAADLDATEQEQPAQVQGKLRRVR